MGVAVGGVRFLEQLAVTIEIVYLPEVRTDSGSAAFGLTALEFSGFAPLTFRAGGLDIGGSRLGNSRRLVRRPARSRAINRGRGLWAVRVWGVVIGPGWSARRWRGVPVLRHEFVVRGDGSGVQPNHLVVRVSAGAYLTIFRRP
jgi:hypothetical protein